MEMTKRVYSTLTKKNLPVFLATSGDLREYFTSQEDVDNGISRMPDRSQRLRSQRLVVDESSDSSDGETIDSKETETDRPGEFQMEEKKAPRKPENSQMLDIYNKSDLIHIEQKDMSTGASEMIFSRKFKYDKKSQGDEGEEEYEVIEEEVEVVEVDNNFDYEFPENAKDEEEEQEYVPRLEDFKIIKVLDKGSFGKVFLVENKSTFKLYAMKRIRKDVLIEKKQIENTKNEK